MQKVIDPIYQGSMVMSRRVLIMRHAKSSWKNQALTDHQRPLNKRGRSDAPRIAAALKEMNWIPDRVFVSDSQRTLETLALLLTEFGELPVQTMEELYHPTTATIHACIESAKKDETVSQSSSIECRLLHAPFLLNRMGNGIASTYYVQKNLISMNQKLGMYCSPALDK